MKKSTWHPREGSHRCAGRGTPPPHTAPPSTEWCLGRGLPSQRPTWQADSLHGSHTDAQAWQAGRGDSAGHLCVQVGTWPWGGWGVSAKA